MRHYILNLGISYFMGFSFVLTHFGGGARSRDGDIIEVDVQGRLVSIRIPDEEIKKRRQDWKRPPLKTKRTSIGRVWELHALPASKGAGLELP